jgi:A/G-specific adenine glycosylase
MTAQPRPDQLATIQHTLLEWYRAHARDLPWRRTRDPYHVLVSEIMLQQTQVDRVIPKYHAFLAQFPTLEALAAAAPGDVIRAWAGLGYNRRALNLQRTAQAVLAEHGGAFPRHPDALQKLPGLGPYTAGAVACFAFEQDVAFMDTNIRRVVRRVFAGPDAMDPQPTERALLDLAARAVPPGNGYTWNQAIMELGALVCTAARPRCTICPLRPHCRAYAAWSQADTDVFEQPPAARVARRAVAERPAQYAGSNRFFRGRLVAILRDAPAGASLTLQEVGPRLKDDWTADDAPWLLGVAQRLAKDGLIVLEGEAGAHARVRLP